MGKQGPVPDAWDDDWESQADKLDAQAQAQPEPQAPLSKAERLAKHAEANRKLWESADTPTPVTFLESQPSVPLATGFKPQVKVLSRKPAPQMIARRDPVTGLEKLSLADDDADDRQEEKPQLTLEEIKAKQQREREEKQRRYDEVRAKIFGESNPSSGASSPGTVTPPRGAGNEGGGRGNQRGRGRGRGGHKGNLSRQEDTRRPGSRSDAARSESGRELYDPNFSPRGGFSMQKRGGDSGQQSGRSASRDEDQPRQAIRAPRGPDGSGRGGFGFAKRGTEEG